MKNFLLILLVLFSTNSIAALNKWVDANGKVHYSDQPPPANVKAQALRPAFDTAAPKDTDGTATASTPAAPKTIAEREAELKKAQQEKQVAATKSAREQEQEKTKQENCKASQQNLNSLQSGARIATTDANGERAYLSDEERQERINRAQRDIKTWCK